MILLGGHFDVVFEEDPDIAIFADRDRGVGSGAFFQAFLMGPGFPVVITQGKNEVLPAFLTVRVDEQKAVPCIAVLF